MYGGGRVHRKTASLLERIAAGFGDPIALSAADLDKDARGDLSLATNHVPLRLIFGLGQISSRQLQIKRKQVNSNPKLSKKDARVTHSFNPRDRHFQHNTISTYSYDLQRPRPPISLQKYSKQHSLSSYIGERSRSDAACVAT